MIYKILLLSITIIAFFFVSASAEAGDPLSSSQVGESMSMPLSPDLLQQARNAGVITGSNALNEPDNQKSSFSVAPQTKADAVNSIDNVNVTGTWSLDLNGEAPEQMILSLIQNEGVVMGRGVINRGDETKDATASGSIFGDKLRIVVMPVGTADLYVLNLSLSTLSAGTYTVHETDGSSRSGEVTFAVSSNVFKPQSTVSEAEPSKNAATNPVAATITPVQLSGSQGSSRRISTSTSTSMSSGGGSMSESSSSSFSGSIM
jgi:hypothetical protein